MESDAVLTARGGLLGTYSKPLAVYRTRDWILLELMLCYKVPRIVSPTISALSSITPVVEQGEMHFFVRSVFGEHHY